VRLIPWYRPTLEQRGIAVAPAPPDPLPPEPRLSRPAGVRYVDHQTVTPAPGNGLTVFAIPHPVVLDDAAPVSVYVRGVAVPVDGYEITSDIESGDGNILTLVDAPSAGDFVTISGFCRDPAP
jgi:hypothetical protein